MKTIILSKVLFVIMIMLNTSVCCYANNADTNHSNVIVIKPNVVVYDFKTKTYLPNFIKPKIHEPIIFKIVNINRLAYKITIKSRDSIIAENEGLTDETDAVTEQMATLKESNKNLQEQIVEMNAKLNVKLLENAQKPTNDNTSQLSSSQKTNDAQVQNNLKSTQKTISEFKMQVAQLEVSKSEDSDKIDSFKIRIQNLQQKLDQEIHKIASAQIKKEEANKKLELQLISLGQQAINAIKKYEQVQAIHEIINQIHRISVLPGTDSTTVLNDDILNSLLKDYPFQTHSTIIRNCLSEIYYFNRNYENYNASIQQLSSYIDQYQTAYFKSIATTWNNNISKIHSTTLRTSGRRDSAQSTYRLLQSPCTYEFSSTPIQPSADLVVFDIDTKSTNANFFNDERSFQFRSFVKGGIRYDFSTGLAFSFGVQDYDYKTEAVDTMNNVRIGKLKNKHAYIPQIAAMMHASLRSYRSISFGFTLGATISTTEFDINSIFPGLSVLIGHRNKFVFTAGPALKKISVLKNIYEEGKYYNADKINPDELTEAAFRVGGFVGITYNLTSKQKSSFKIGQ